MQEQINERAIGLYIKAGKITGRVLADAMRKYLKNARDPTDKFDKNSNSKGGGSNEVKRGKQSLKSLRKQGAALSDIEITGDNIGSFKRIARKYNIDFALQCDKSESLGADVRSPKWLVCLRRRTPIR